MSVAVLHRDDFRPSLEWLPGLAVDREADPATMAELQSVAVGAIEARMAAGHRAYVATVDGVRAAWGWVATRRASIGELGLTFSVPEGERYLWNFVTRPAFRGRGIYPRLLQEIVRRESMDADRFWIVYAPENRASEKGIVAAGFQRAADLSFGATGGVALQPRTGEDASLFGAPLVEGGLTPCWRCARAGREWLMRCAPGACQCDYQRPQVACHDGTTALHSTPHESHLEPPATVTI
jgi:ribosomal protein S18 acetylase RimI-like enzyme